MRSKRRMKISSIVCKLCIAATLVTMGACCYNYVQCHRWDSCSVPQEDGNRHPVGPNPWLPRETDHRNDNSQDAGASDDKTSTRTQTTKSKSPSLREQPAQQEDHSIGNTTRPIPKFDPNGYILFCLCMGNVGNQMDHLLGTLALAKTLDRTLVIPPLAYGSVPFTDWLQFKPLLAYHRVISAEDFLKYIAPEHWPPGKREVFCRFTSPSSPQLKNDCWEGRDMFKNFWVDSLGITFDKHVVCQLSLNKIQSPDKWRESYPPAVHPVLAFERAPASYPVIPAHRHLQKFLVFSDRIQRAADAFVNANFPSQKFVALHLRDGSDWVTSCSIVTDKFPYYMSSPQCLPTPDRKFVTYDICLPNKTEILRLTKDVVISTGYQVIFVASDHNHMIDDLENALKEQKVKVHRMKAEFTKLGRKDLPLIDLAILSMSDYFIGNCVSSFTGFVKRARDVAGKPSTFWGFSVQ